MPVFTRKRGESIFLGDGTTVSVVRVGRVLAGFRITLPPGVQIHRATVRNDRSPASVSRRRRPARIGTAGTARERPMGFSLAAGEVVLVGQVRLRLVRIEAGSTGRVARVEVTAPEPPEEATTQSSVRSIDDVTPEELLQLLTPGGKPGRRRTGRE